MNFRGCIAGIGVVLGLGASAAGDAHAERLIVSVSNHRVTVTPNYAGEELVLFGSIEKDSATPADRKTYDLVVTVAGPRSDMVARRKERRARRNLVDGLSLSTSRRILSTSTSTRMSGSPR